MLELICKIITSTELWAAVMGAIVGAAAGGYIAYRVQLVALTEAEKQRKEDRRRLQQALAASLLFKMMRIQANYKGVHNYIEQCFSEAAKKGMHDEPWRFVLPLASLPTAIQFSSEEMTMLLEQRDDDVFNAMLEVDVLYNHLVGGLATLQTLRPALMERIPPEKVSGDTGKVVLDPEVFTALRPRMIELNALIEHLREDARRGVNDVGKLLDRLQRLLRKRLDLPYKVAPLQDAQSEEVKP